MVEIVMKFLFIIVWSLHLVHSRPKVVKNAFEGDASDIMFLDKVVKDRRHLLSSEMGA